MSKARTLTPEESTSRTALPAAQRVAPLAYRVDDAAAIIGVSTSKVWALIRDGRLLARRLDGSAIIRHEDLAAFVDGLPDARSIIPAPKPLPPRAPSKEPPSLPEPPTFRRLKGAERAIRPKTPREPPKGTDALPKRPSPELAAIVGSEPLSRPEALDMLWRYIWDHQLQTPQNKRVIFCDETFKALAGKDQIMMGRLFEICRNHLSPM